MNGKASGWLQKLFRLPTNDFAEWVARSDWQYRKNIEWLLRYRGFLASNLYVAFWLLYLTRTLQMPLWLAFDLVSLTFLLSIGAEFPTGYLADRFSRRQYLMIGTVMCMVGLGICASATHGDYWIVVPGLIIDEIGSSIAAGPDDGLANETAHLLVGKRTVEQIRGQYNHGRVNYVALFRAAGGLIGGLLAVHLGLRSTVWAQVIAYGLAFYCAYRVVEPNKQLKQKGGTKEKTEGVGSFRQVVRQIVTDREIMATILYAGAVLGLLQFSYNFLSIYFSRVHLNGAALSVGYFGIAWSAFMVSPWVFKKTSLARRFTERFAGHERRMYVVLALLASVSLVVAGLWVSLVGLVALLGIYFVNTVQQPETGNRLMGYVDKANPKMQSSAASARQLVTLLIAGAFSLLTGFISKEYSFGAAMVVMGILFGLIAGVSLLLMTTPKAKPRGRHARSGRHRKGVVESAA